MALVGTLRALYLFIASYDLTLTHSKEADGILTHARFACSLVTSRPGRLTQLLICNVWKAAKRMLSQRGGRASEPRLCQTFLSLSALHNQVVDGYTGVARRLITTSDLVTFMRSIGRGMLEVCGSS